MPTRLPQALQPASQTLPSKRQNMFIKHIFSDANLTFRLITLAFFGVISLNANAAPEPATHQNIASINEVNAAPNAYSETSREIQIGKATETLLNMQRTGAKLRPRPIDGEHASRSYQRYLKSFETTIPEHYSSGIDVGSGSSGSR